MKVWLKEIGGAFFLQFISRWRVLDGGCPSLNKVDIVVLNLVGSALAAILWDPAETIPTMLSIFLPWIPSIWVRLSPQMLGLLL